MSLLFVKSSSQYLQRASVPSLTLPFAVSMWVYPITLTAGDRVFGFFNTGTITDMHEILVQAASVVARTEDTTNARTSTTAGAPSTGAWQHILAQFVSTSDVRIYLDGTIGAAGGAGTPTPASLGVTTIARRSTSSPGNYFDGRIAEVSIWDLTTALSTSEIAQLVAGVHPLKIRTSELVSHYPHLLAVDATQDVIGSLGLTHFAAPTSAEHPPLIQPGRPFAHTAEGVADITRQIANNITFSNLVTQVIDAAASNLITFAVDGESNIITRPVSNQLIFANSVSALKVLSIALQSNIFFTQAGKKTIVDSASNLVTFANQINRGENPDNAITLLNNAAATQSTPSSNIIAFSTSVTAALVLNLNSTNIVTFSNSAIAVIPDNCDLYEYTPFGAGLPAAPVLTADTTIQLIYSATTLTLRNPDFGDTVTINPKRVLNRSRKGTIRIFQRALWTKRREFTFTISLLTEAEKDAILLFNNDSLGQSITYIDSENRSWIGTLLEPEAPITEEGPNDCQYQASFRFRGVPA